MKFKLNRCVVPGAFVAVASLISACSSINEVMSPDKIDYRSAAQRTSTLDIPPDLTRIEGDRRYAAPVQDGVSTLSGYNQAARAQPQPGAENVLPTVDGVRVLRDGNQRWLEIRNGMSGEQLWRTLREFWQESGFLLVQDSPKTGIMETDWAENRAKIPQDFIRNTLGKVFDNLYSTAERDKFRTRIERGQNGALEVFISHRGAQEQLKGLDKSTTVWTPRPADPELEAEFLSRLAQRLGMQKEQAERMAKAPGTVLTPLADKEGIENKAMSVAEPARAPLAPGNSYLSQINGVHILQMPEPFDRAWRAVGLALDRVNFTVEDRDRAQGLYYVRYVDTRDIVERRGFFSRLFTKTGGEAARQAKTYRVALKSDGTGTTVMVLNNTGQAEATEISKRILTLLDEQLH